MTTEQTKQRAELIESLERKLSDAEQIKASSIAIRTFQVEQILTALKQKEWIKIEDGLPDEITSVLVTGNKIRSVALFKDGIFYPDFNVLKHNEVTHWMSLPTPPTES